MAFGGDAAVRVFEQRVQLVHVEIVVEAHSDPSSGTDIGRAEESLWSAGDQGALNSLGRRAPQVSELVIVMALHPEHGELTADEKRRRAVTEFLGDFRKCQADGPNLALKIDGPHALTLCRLALSRQAPFAR